MALKLEKKYNKDKNAWIIKPIGEVDIYTSPNFKKELTDIIKENETDVIIDCSQLEYIDSTGLGVLISGLKKIKEKDKNIIIEHIKPNIKKLLDITGLNKVFIVKE
ncbi:STAS domain-containing protein [Thermohalobacter berrensis]|uniref:Anti-sigma factor antagonist n=1 Tax=Thermohalobacter berrensis TaxID=99594 RepID=A0A419T1N5_9FIRM|nr:STAS domain-containing protein [Thermohalobacter berrensis]RKD31363.1 anti-anti-sigma factor [Thermohalobacter berrensis]